ncbi:ABC transporter ATP-binding protein [Ancylobacter tetraedralis]|nr:ABC transporter ATP-binding protein [Ancylobacter tetraedralis]
MTAGLTFNGINKSFGGAHVLRQVSLDVASGEFLSLLGPSGCGKSTLLRIIAGLERQDAGTVAIGGRRVDDLRPKQRDIAMVFQSYALYPHMSVADNIALPLRMRRLSGMQRLPLVGGLLPGSRTTQAGIAKEVTRTARALGIESLLARKPGQLSGGQRQRVAVGRAMVRNPAIFLMDEPLSNLDAKLRVQMRAEIKELHRRLGVTFIYVTHDQTEAMTMSDRVAVMAEGEILQVDAPQVIYADPANRKVAEFVGSPKINMLPARFGADLTHAAGTTFDVRARELAGTAGTLGIRPEALHLAEAPGTGIFTGRVRLLEHMGSDLFVHLDLPHDGEGGTLIARLLAERAPQIAFGQTLHLGVRTGRILVFAADGRRVQPDPAPAAVLRSYA